MTGTELRLLLILGSKDITNAIQQLQVALLWIGRQSMTVQ